MKMEQTECSETSAYKFQTPGNHPKESIQHSVYGEILKYRCTNFTNLFCHETLHVLDSSSVHHQEFIHCKLSKCICHTGLYTAFEQDQDVPPWSCSKAAYKLVWLIPLLSVQWINSWWLGQKNCPKHVEFHDKINFVKLVHLVGFITKKSIEHVRILFAASCSASEFFRILQSWKIKYRFYYTSSFDLC